MLGVTEFLKRRVALPFRGSYAEFRHTIRHELVHVFQLSLASQTFGRYPRFRQIGVPLWWTEGLAEFFSAGEDSRDDMVLRDMTIDGQLPSLPDLAYAYGGLVYPVGGSIHRFLAERYGEWRILELYNDIWKYNGFDAALLGVYGRTIEQLSEEWQYWIIPFLRVPDRRERGRRGGVQQQVRRARRIVFLGPAEIESRGPLPISGARLHPVAGVGA